MENLKVYELAKQMGMETIGLMDKLREFKIPVKSHMADLNEELLGQIKLKFAEEKTKSAPKAAKGTKTKKAPAKVEVSKAIAAAPTAAIKSTKSAAKSMMITKPVTAARKPLPGAVAPISRTVIRRKAGAADELPLIEGEVQEQYANIISTPELYTETETPSASPSVTAASVSSPVVTGAGAAAPVAMAAAGATAPMIPVKRGVSQIISKIDLRTTMGNTQHRSGAGRPPFGSSGGPGMSTGVNGDRPQRPPMGVGSAPTPTGDEKFDREELGKLIKQEALVQAKKAAALLRETKIETFNAADFRKRELMFQPKKKKMLTGRMGLKTQITKPGAQKRKIKIQGGITALNLAQAMGMRTDQFLRKLTALGTEGAIASTLLDVDTATLIAHEQGYEIENRERSEEQMIEQSQVTTAESADMVPRPPVVTIMGHVDHGKTSLLDAIRSTNVTKGEAGGITQHIGAYCVEIDGKRITFLDTPGHEAFTAMRARGAKVTDIVVLVVASDDGIMPQTREAIAHAKAAGVPIIVAINKMDVPGANPQKVMQTLTEFELVPEEWGGTTIIAKVSALKKEGIKELLEMILLQAEILELKAQPNKQASGVVIEARLDRGRGTVATILIQDGTARLGDIIVAGTAYGRVRAMMNDKGQQMKTCPPGEPVEILGLNSVPNASDTFVAVADEATAREIAERRSIAHKLATGHPTMKMTLEDLFAKVQKSEVKELPIIIKTDVQGSAEAIKDMLNKIESEKVKVKILASAVGGVTESDVLLASASNAVIIGFNVRPEGGVNAVAEREGVEIKSYSIIYELLDDVKKAMSGMLAPTFVEKSLGRADVRNVFAVSKVGTIAGCSVTEGKLTRQSSVRLLRDSKIIFDGKLSSLKRFKDDAREVAAGYECGLGIENYNDIKVGDVIEAYVKEQVQTLLN